MSANPFRERGLPLAVVLSILLVGCATPDRIVLLPQEDGTPSAIVVRSKGQEAVLDQPYAVASVGRRIETGTTDATAVATRYRAVNEALPPHPRSYTLNFEFGRTQMTRESQALLDRILEEMQTLPAPEMVIIGHTDDVGRDAVNDELSLKRANSVLAAIKAKGITLRDVSVVGRGKREPLVPQKPGKPEPRNRRVEIRVK
ncbi:MAG: OmpA family protein [Azospira sp.]|jgi:outer membrane protein OmpA-like peptidoglycan-associated protein|nr:OmpA family protein [Azospira sp.]